MTTALDPVDRPPEAPPEPEPTNPKPIGPDRLAGVVDAIRQRLNAALRGKADVVEQVLVCLLAQGHLLLEDLPGLGKTTLAKALADAVGGTFGRLQCTPDLLPSDVTGFNLFNQKTHEFDFRRGPVFADVLLADEINRATPRTQSALLEAMAERQVTVDAERFGLSETFFVIATQNPVDQHGTYPLPEAQLDRFAMRLSVGYPSAADESRLLGDAIGPGGLAGSRPSGAGVLKPGELAALQRTVAGIAVVDAVRGYIVALGTATRNDPGLLLGTSPRGLLTLMRCSQARAAIAGRDFVTPDDVQAVTRPVLGVRLASDRDGVDSILDRILDQTPVPQP